MEFIHIDSEAFKSLKKQLDNIEREIRKLKDPVQVLSSEWLTIDEAAQALRVTRRTMFNYIYANQIFPNRINRKSYFHIDDVRELLAQKSVAPDPSKPRATRASRQNDAVERTSQTGSKG
jgi:hypothetical protein